MTTATQRKPDTPLTNFFALGKYDKPIPVKDGVSRNAEPGLGATISMRNPDPINGELNVKVITSKDVDLNNYNPKSYLNPSHMITRQ